MRDTPQGRDALGAEQNNTAGPSVRDLWYPLIAVISVLVLLAVAPIVVSMRLRRIRTTVTELIEPARLRASDLASVLAVELSVLPSRGAPVKTLRPMFDQAHGTEKQDVLALDSLLRFGQPSAVEQFAQYREEAARWHDDLTDIFDHAPSDASLDTARTDGLAALAAVRRLDVELATADVETRARMRNLAGFDVYLPVALVPLALLACLLTIRAGRRTVALAARAEQERVARTKAMEEKSALIRGFSHDLQNPLGAALGHIDLILEGIIRPADQRETLGRVRRLLSSAIETGSGLLSLARSDSSELPLAPTTFDLCALCRAAVDDHTLVASTREQTIGFVGPSECTAVGDAGRVRHIVDNLLSNAIKYAPAGGRIRLLVTTRRRDNRTWSVVTVQDSGHGIPDAWRERIFEEFARVPGASDNIPGHGIGLTMSRRIARLMGGDVTLESSADTKDESGWTGAGFALWLASDDTRVSRPERSADSTDSSGDRGRMSRVSNH